MTHVLHAITPGDHFSPRTGSAIPTVVDGLAAAAGRDRAPFQHFVVLDRSTMRPRYDSATAIEYTGTRGPTRRERVVDLARGRVGLSRSAVARFYEPVAEAIRAREPAFVLAHNAPVLPWLLRDTEHRVVLYAHNELLRTYSRRETARMLDSVAAIVCVSESLAARMRRALPARLASRVHVVLNGVDCAQFTPWPEIGEQRPSDDQQTRDSPLPVMFVGRMIAEKGADVLIRAAAILARDDLEFVLIGSYGFDRNAALSRYETRLRAIAAERGALVRFEPFVDRPGLPAILREAGILVVPSRWPDPCPLTVGEALATGRPLVVSRIGGIPEVVGPAGRYVEPNDPAALAAAITELADDANLRRTMGLAAREHAEAHDWAWAWSNLRRVLEEL